MKTSYGINKGGFDRISQTLEMFDQPEFQKGDYQEFKENLGGRGEVLAPESFEFMLFSETPDEAFIEAFFDNPYEESSEDEEGNFIINEEYAKFLDLALEKLKNITISNTNDWEIQEENSITKGVLPIDNYDGLEEECKAALVSYGTFEIGDYVPPEKIDPSLIEYSVEQKGNYKITVFAFYKEELETEAFDRYLSNIKFSTQMSPEWSVNSKQEGYVDLKNYDGIQEELQKVLGNVDLSGLREVDESFKDNLTYYLEMPSKYNKDRAKVTLVAEYNGKYDPSLWDDIRNYLDSVKPQEAGSNRFYSRSGRFEVELKNSPHLLENLQENFPSLDTSAWQSPVKKRQPKASGRNIMINKKSHKLWNASTDSKGNIMVHRTEAEREDLESFEYLKTTVATSLGLWGASIVDYSKFGKLPQSIRARYASVAKELKASGEVPPKVLSWKQLNAAFGSDKVNEALSYIKLGMETRQASKFLDVPFLVAADLLEDLHVVGKKAMKVIVDDCKAGNIKKAAKYGKVASRVVKSLSMPSKLAVDKAAEDYWTAYFGPYGEQLVKEVKKRVKADLAKIWLVKEGVDSAAAEYWSNYYTDLGYGKEMVKEIPKRLSPKASLKKKI